MKKFIQFIYILVNEYIKVKPLFLLWTDWADAIMSCNDALINSGGGVDGAILLSSTLADRGILGNIVFETETIWH